MAQSRFINKREKQICEYENPLILFYEKRVTHHSQLQRALEIVMGMNRPVVIICEDAEQEGLAFLAVNNAKGVIQCCVVQSPEYGDKRREGMEDLAVVTGGTYLSDISGIGIKDVKQSHFGQAKKVIISKDETIIIGGNGNPAAVENLLNELRMNLAEAKTEDDKFPIEKRIAKLSGGVAVIQVGAATETEVRERLDRFDDAVRATKAATAEGFVIGGGMALHKINPPTDFDENYLQAYQLVFNCIKEPFVQMVKNAGYSDIEIMLIVGKFTKVEKYGL
jgi:chaperonin GroEL